MNKKQILIGMMLIAVAFFTSCNHDDLQYSCDPVIDAWTKAHIQEIQVMNRADFLNLDYARQKAVFNAFTPQQRMNLWKTKLEETLQLEWTASECIHIETALNMVIKNVEWFNNNRSQEIMDRIEIETYKWYDYAITNLQWDIETIYAIAGTPLSVVIGKDELLVVEAHSEERGRQKCDCTLFDATSSVNCGSGKKCNDPDCSDQTHFGCGWFWMRFCDGICGDKDTSPNCEICDMYPCICVPK